MQIHKLVIRNIRGIRKICLEPKGENIVIWGPNGSGKSAVVDAIEFLLQGKISRLEGVGTEGLNLRNHGRHIDQNDLKKCKVQAWISLPGEEGIYKVSRTLANSKCLEAENKYISDKLEFVLEIAEAKQYVLTRREILRFITAKMSDRASLMQSLLRLSRCEDIRKQLVSASNKAKRVSEEEEDSVSRAKRDLAKEADLREYDEGEILKSINREREKLSAAPIKNLNPSIFTDQLQKPTFSKTTVNAENLYNVAKRIKTEWKELVQQVYDEVNEVKPLMDEFCANRKIFEELKKYDLKKAGIDLISEDGNCPLCGAEWPRGELIERLTEELKKMNEMAEKRKEIKRRIRIIKNFVKEIIDEFEEAKKNTAALKLHLQTGLLEKGSKRLERYSAKLNSMKDDKEVFELEYIFPPKFLKEQYCNQFWEKLEQLAQRLGPKITPEEEAWNSIKRLQEKCEVLKEREENFKKAQKTNKYAEEAKNAFVQAKDEILSELYRDICNRFEGLYRSLHAIDGESEFTATLKETGSGVKMEVDFWGRGLFPPNALHSEGHQDSMGICLFCALSEHLSQDYLKIVVLDDVVTSVDAGHRRKLCEMLKNNFSQTQFIITTHDKTWVHQLKSTGIVKSKNIVKFSYWDVASGPRYSNNFEWEKINEYLENQDIQEAGILLRNSMEEFYATVCENIKAKVVYCNDGQYTLGDYFPAAWKRYNQLAKMAKQSANEWGREDLLATITETHERAKKLYIEANAEQWSTNTAIHFNYWHQLNKEDLEKIVEAMK